MRKWIYLLIMVLCAKNVYAVIDVAPLDRELIKKQITEGYDYDNTEEYGAKNIYYRMYRLNYNDDLKFLLENGIGINLEFLKSLVSTGDLDLVQIFIDRGFNLNEVDSNGETAIFSVRSPYNALDMVKLLVENGADTTIRNKYNQTALFRAVTDGNIDVVRYLLALEKDINAQDAFGNTLLMTVFYYNIVIDEDCPTLGIYSNQEKRTALIKLLLESGVNPHLYNNINVNTLYLAKYTDTTVGEKLLYEYGVKPSEKREVKCTHWYIGK